MSDPLDMMTACHGRIRDFTSGLGRLAALPDPHDPRAPAAAAQCYRYFREGLPLHALDEDVSLAPRLRRHRPGAEVEEALDRIAEEHHRIDAVLDMLLPLLEAVPNAPPRQLLEAHAALCEVLLPHIAMEEKIIFPACALLSLDDRSVMIREMRARRG